MSFSYQQAGKQIALRANQLGDGSDVSALVSDWTLSLSAILEGFEIPYPALKANILAAEAKIVETIGFSTLTAYRSAFFGRTTDLSNGDQIPSVDVSGKEFFGEFGAVLDSITKRPLTEKTPQEIERVNSFCRMDKFYFYKQDTVLFHTRPNGAYLVGVSYSKTSQDSVFDANGNSPLPASCETWLIAETLASSAQEDWFHAEAAIYADIAAQCKADVLRGVVPSAKLPPTTAKFDPVKE